MKCGFSVGCATKNRQGAETKGCGDGNLLPFWPEVGTKEGRFAGLLQSCHSGVGSRQGSGCVLLSREPRSIDPAECLLVRRSMPRSLGHRDVGFGHRGGAWASGEIL